MVLIKGDHMNMFEIVHRFVQDGAVIPVDVATSLVDQGYDISSLTDALDGYSVEDLIDRYEEVYG